MLNPCLKQAGEKERKTNTSLNVWQGERGKTKSGMVFCPSVAVSCVLAWRRKLIKITQ